MPPFFIYEPIFLEEIPRAYSSGIYRAFCVVILANRNCLEVSITRIDVCIFYADSQSRVYIIGKVDHGVLKGFYIAYIACNLRVGRTVSYACISV